MQIERIIVVPNELISTRYPKNEHKETPSFMSENTKQANAEKIRDYIDTQLITAKENGQASIELASGQIHKQLGLKNNYRNVVKVMKEQMQAGDRILQSTASREGATIRIKYVAAEREAVIPVILDPSESQKPAPKPKNANPQHRIADKVRDYIKDQFQQARDNNLPSVELVSGDIHTELGLRNNLPLVCDMMYKKMGEDDEIINKPEDENSPKLRIRYMMGW